MADDSHTEGLLTEASETDTTDAQLEAFLANLTSQSPRKDIDLSIPDEVNLPTDTGVVPPNVMVTPYQPPVVDVRPIHDVIGYPGSTFSVNLAVNPREVSSDHLEITTSSSDALDLTPIAKDVGSGDELVTLYRYNVPEYGSTMVHAILRGVSETYRKKS